LDRYGWHPAATELSIAHLLIHSPDGDTQANQTTTTNQSNLNPNPNAIVKTKEQFNADCLATHRAFTHPLLQNGRNLEHKSGI